MATTEQPITASMPPLHEPLVVEPITIWGARLVAGLYVGLLAMVSLRNANVAQLGDFAFLMVFFAVGLSPLLMLASMIGMEVSLCAEGVRKRGFLGRQKLHAWGSLKKVECASGRGMSRRMILRFSHPGSKVEISNARYGFWAAADYLKEAADGQAWVLSYGLLGLGGIAFWLPEENRGRQWV